ncbi:OmpA family protein [Runella slithyformis]|uniref:OmpA/MotB domain protein n=1 Tax=Runella slithyformis (strain ATCC 29530 / DSM 19594 / LMG 11500 / NCIMB 11436 / LSU 4) TaxID=761193 RepID=A0A7U3ZLL3_RUNSL|nr:OmpA family protein [Runella slithyformis]AEI49448.1 OmpA/MotB domain protein [Runella slithyformis DSM 19594]
MNRSVFLFLFYSFCFYSGFGQDEFSLGIEVRDKYTNRILIPIISVLPANSPTELRGQMIYDQYVVNVIPDINYLVVVAFQEYKTYRQNHTFVKNTSGGRTTLMIELEPLTPPKSTVAAPLTPQEQTIIVTDKTLRSSIANAVISLKETASGANVPVKKNPTVSGGWLAVLKTDEKYTVTVTADGYPSFLQTFIPKAGEAAQIAITRAPKQDVQFQAVDALTGKVIPADFMLTNELKETYSGTTKDDNTVFSPRISVLFQPYTLTVTAAGYRKHESQLTVSTASTEPSPVQLIRLSKGNITVRAKVVEEQSDKPIPATLRIINRNEKKEVFNQKNTFNGQIPITLTPDGQYIIEVESKGYMPFRKELEKAITPLTETNTLTIKLAKIGEIYLKLSAVNSATGRQVPATFKITATLTGQVTRLKGREAVRHKIVEPDIYQIETTAAGFAPLKGTIDAEEISVGQLFNYIAQLVPASSAVQTAIDAPIQTFSFAVFDAQTQKHVPNVRLKITNQTTQKAIGSRLVGKNIQARLKTDQTYAIEAGARGYENITMLMSVAEWVNRGEYLTNISLVPTEKMAVSPAKSMINEKIFDNIKAGQSVSIEDNIYFDRSSYILRTEAYGQLLRLAAILKKNPDIQIEIVGHTDNVGDPRLNKILSEQRAKVISNFLFNEGVAESRLMSRGEGSNKPIAPNDTDDNRRRNRRVQFLVK